MVYTDIPLELWMMTMSIIHSFGNRKKENKIGTMTLKVSSFSKACVDRVAGKRIYCNATSRHGVGNLRQRGKRDKYKENWLLWVHLLVVR